jgi:trk system potassium uptake protein TrkA
VADRIMHLGIDRPERRGFRHEGEIVVIGLGRFGTSLAGSLVDMGYEVLGVDLDADRVQQMSGTLTHVTQADTTNRDTLRQIGVADAVTVVVGIGNDVEASVLTTVALDDLGVENIWAKAITEAHGSILSRVGAHHVVFPEAEMGARVAHLVTGSMLEYFALDDDFVIAELIAPEQLSGVPLGESHLRATYKVTVVCVKPSGGQFTYADRDTVLAPNDLIVIAGHRRDVEHFTVQSR